MVKIANNYTDLIGNTPMLRLHKFEQSNNLEAQIIGKLESFNPLSSVKDRLAFALIEELENRGLITEHSLIVEPSSGNTGVGLAFVCAAKGYKLLIFGPETMSKERVQIMRALGAEVRLTPQPEGMKGAIARAEDVLRQNKNAVMPMQFENIANARIHRMTTAVEILNDTDRQVDFFVAGVGTGGTITGVGEVLKSELPNVKIIAVEPTDSPVLSGGVPGPHKIQGIGAGFVPQVLNRNVIDEIIQVTNEEAFQKARELSRVEGVLVGISSGAALQAATVIAKRPENKGKRIIVVLPDSGERYLSTPLFDY
ncbi:MAG TPA: cysteine synthase A [Bacilli bacterium]|nr:cysteine synthase A [Bacilli bacterium]